MGTEHSIERARDFVDALLHWFRAAMRPLPWRITYDPYHVWISEIMLQQTQMERGVRYFEAWMRRFPDVLSVAGAGEEQILSAWEGLGYYSRARNLHAAARIIAEEHGGRFPGTFQAIRRLPGVGEYTAGAIAAIAFDLPEPAVDANVLRIFSRILDIDAPVAAKGVGERVTGLVRTLLSLASPRLLSQGLMELGALVCSKRPKCEVCPVAEHCIALRRGTVAERPVKAARAAYSRLEMAAAVIVQGERVLVRKRPPRGLWAGLWEFPCGEVRPGESPAAAAARLARSAAGAVTEVESIGVFRHGYTRYRVALHGYRFEAAAGSPPREGEWTPWERVSALAFAAGQRKLLERLGWK